MEYKSQLQKLKKNMRKLVVTVPVDSVTAAYEKGVLSAQKRSKLKGFRPGKAPLSVVKQVYGDDIRNQVFKQLIDESFQKAVDEHDLKLAGRPNIDTPKHKDHLIREGEELSYTATVEVIPDVEPKKYKGLALKREKVELTDKDVDLVVSHFKESQAQLVPLEEEGHVCAKGDYVDFEFSGGTLTDGVFKEHPGMKGQRVLEVGSGELIAGFEDELIGLKQDESKTFEIKFPADYPEKTLAGGKAQFTVKIHEFKKKILPEVNEEFAKQVGYESVEDLRSKAKAHLLRERTSEVDRRLRSDLLQKLIEKNPFDLPETLKNSQAQALTSQLVQDLKRQGMNENLIKDTLSKETQNILAKAENQVRVGLILEAISKMENVTVSEEDIETELKMIAQSGGHKEADVKDYYRGNAERMESLEFKIREDKTVKFLLDQASIKEA